MPYSPIKIANRFLALAEAEKPARPLTPLQLIKLVYIAHGWSLGLTDKPLSSEPAQAWLYGPVIPSLYRSIRHFRASPVCGKVVGDTDPQELSEEANSVIDAVYRAYSRFSGTQLSNLTHQPETPWSISWEKEGQNAVIDNTLIAAHYKEISKQRAAP